MIKSEKFMMTFMVCHHDISDTDQDDQESEVCDDFYGHQRYNNYHHLPSNLHHNLHQDHVRFIQITDLSS